VPKKRAKNRTVVAPAGAGSDAERKEAAVRVAQRRFPGLDPGVDIGSQLDEPGEKATVADFLNGPVADWIRITYPAWRWTHVTPDDFGSIATVRDFAWLCYRHLTPAPTPAPPGSKAPALRFS
jgi:hypothetical protein